MRLFPSLAIYFVIWWLCLFVILPFGANSQHETGEVTPGTDASAPTRLYVFRRVVATSLLAGLIFIGMGVYNAVATWLQPVLANFSEGGAAGNLIAVLTAGGIVGAAVLPPMVAAHNQRRTMLVFALGLVGLVLAVMPLPSVRRLGARRCPVAPSRTASAI